LHSPSVVVRFRGFPLNLTKYVRLPGPPILHFNHWFYVGLPDIPYFTGAPVFEPQSPASRNEATWEMKSPVFQLGPVSHQSPHTYPVILAAISGSKAEQAGSTSDSSLTTTSKLHNVWCNHTAM